jgi:hypothetical protein
VAGEIGGDIKRNWNGVKLHKAQRKSFLRREGSTEPQAADKSARLKIERWHWT